MLYWDIYKRIDCSWVGCVKAPDEDSAIEIATNKFNISFAAIYATVRHVEEELDD